jgi:hypothetical protein
MVKAADVGVVDDERYGSFNFEVRQPAEACPQLDFGVSRQLGAAEVELAVV